MKKVLSRCLALALALCLVCSSCLAEAGYEAIKEYIDNESAVEGTSDTSMDSYSVDAGSFVLLCFFFDDCSMWLFGVNAQGEEEVTAWFPSLSVFYEVMKDCVGHWDELSSYPSDGYELLIAIQTTRGEDPYYIRNTDEATEVYGILSSFYVR